MSSLIANNAVIVGKRVLVFFCTSIEKDGLRKQEVVDFPDATVAKTGSLPGLYVFDDFVSEEESAEIVKALDSGKWEKLLNRRVQHFGYEFKYGTNNVNKEESLGTMPDFLTFLEPRIAQILKGFKLDAENFVEKYEPQESVQEESKEANVLDKFGYFDQLTVNDYMPGQGIPPHVDTHSPFQEVFAALSLKSGATMHFKD